MATKCFDIEAHVVWVCEGGRSAYVHSMDKGGRTTTFLCNMGFMDYDRNYQADQEAAMAAVEETVSGERLWKRLSRRATK